MRSLRPLIAAAAGSLLLAPGTAQAKIFLITHGDTVHEYGRPKIADQEMPGDMVVGYKYSYGGVFWLDAWTWGGEYCVYSPGKKSYNPIPKPLAALLLGVPESDLSVPFWYRFPALPFALGVIAALFVPYKVLSGMARAKAEKRTARLMEDPKYLEAVSLATAPGPDDLESRKARLEAGVAVLARAGVPEDEARTNLVALVRQQTAP